MYGGKAEMPNYIDILVAGFACDDFSLLNNSPKTLEARGESGDTFFALKEYMEIHHPPIVILENLDGAPWNAHAAASSMKKGEQYPIDEYLHKIGYETGLFQCDTKDHYIPHTRNRGYMICIYSSSLPEDTNWKIKEQNCRELFLSLKQRPTVPVEAMLLPADDPRLQVLITEEKPRDQPVPWHKIKLGHASYVIANGFGDKHPITNWKQDGSLIMPDFHGPIWGMTERVADTIDIAHLRNLTRGIDDRWVK